MINRDDKTKDRTQLLSELIAYKQWASHLESEANQQRITESALKNNQVAFDALFESSYTGMALVRDEKVIKANSAFSELLNISEDGGVYKNLTELAAFDIQDAASSVSTEKTVSSGTTEIRYRYFLVDYNSMRVVVLSATDRK